MLIEIVIFLVTFVFAYILYANYKVHKTLMEKDVKFIPGLPMYGNTFLSTIQKKHFADEIIEIYNAFPNERYVAFIEGSTPIIIIRDIELTKAITVKNFDHFVDHKEFFPAEVDIFSKSLFGMKGDRWHAMRTTLSPAFTGSKMRMMLPSMIEVTNNAMNYLRGNVGTEIDVDDMMRRFSNDVIASAGFGLQVNSFEDLNNEFFVIGQSLFEFTTRQIIVSFLYMQIPFLTKILKLPFFPESTTNFFRRIVTSTMEYREKNNIERPDMIQLLMEASKGTLHSTPSTKDDVGFATVNEEIKPTGETIKWSVDDLVGQVFLFFNAGFETSASSLVMCVHEMAINTAVQDKLYEEIKNFNDTTKLSYENIGQLKYLDCVLNETLRKWSAAIIMDRMCVKPYELPPPREGGKPYVLKPGDVVYNMVNAVQLDPQYYPDPLKFDPERFSDENKHKIAPFTFMPFGMGPRNCIGKCERTTDPIRMKNNGFLIKADKGTWVRFEERKV